MGGWWGERAVVGDGEAKDLSMMPRPLTENGYLTFQCEINPPRRAPPKQALNLPDRIMSKVKAPKNKGVPNKHIHARASFLYQAATYLTLQIPPDKTNGQEPSPLNESAVSNQSPIALRLGSDLQQVSRKAQLRLAVDLKRTICKTCNSVLISGRTATQEVENLSKGGRKPWADVLVIQCKLCGGKKRFPIGSKPQPSKSRQQLKETTKVSVIDKHNSKLFGQKSQTDTEQSSTTK